MSTDPIPLLTDLTHELQLRLDLEDLLQLVVDRTASLLDTPRVSIRLLDPTGTRLLAVCRAGSPLHLDKDEQFRVGEGLMGWIVEHVQPIRSGRAEQDERFVPKPGMQDRMGSFLGVPLVAGNAVLGVINAVHPGEDAFDASDEAQLRLLAGICSPYVEMARMSRLARVDPLTGALNRRGLEQALEEPTADLPEGVLSVVMADLDHFKRVNDTYGHAAGDEVLRQLARLLAQVVRQGDAVVRYGGEEFLLLLPGVRQTTAGRVAERARRSVEAHRFVIGEFDLDVTVSFGVAQRHSGETREHAIERADAALYRAKTTGRNRVEIAEADEAIQPS